MVADVRNNQVLYGLLIGNLIGRKIHPSGTLPAWRLWIRSFYVVFTGGYDACCNRGCHTDLNALVTNAVLTLLLIRSGIAEAYQIGRIGGPTEKNGVSRVKWQAEILAYAPTNP